MKFLKKDSFYILGYLLELIIKLWEFGKIVLQNLVNLGHLFYGISSLRSK